MPQGRASYATITPRRVSSPTFLVTGSPTNFSGLSSLSTSRLHAERLLARWDDGACDEFVKVFPTDYKRVLEEQARRERDAILVA